MDENRQFSTRFDMIFIIFFTGFPHRKTVKTKAIYGFYTNPQPLLRELLISFIKKYMAFFDKRRWNHMKLVCSKSNLLKSINISMKAVPSRTTMTILECILIDASSSQIKFISNDMELGIETIAEGMILEKGIVAVDAKIFYEIIRRLPDSDVSIESDSNYVLSIKCEKANFKIPGKSGEDFTYLPIIDRDHSLTVSQFTLKEMIRQTIFSIAVNENNPMMTGELIETKDHYLKMVSLDGHRISIRRTELKKDYPDTSVVVPGKTLNEISKILSGEMDDQVSIYFTRNHIMFEFDQTMVVSRLIEGEYFRVDHMLSKDYEIRLSINKKEFLDCIERSTLLVKEGDKKPIVVNVIDNQMEMRIDSALGSMREDINVEKEGKDIVIGFNPKFLADALRVIDDETIDIYMVNAKAPCFIKDEQELYTYLILPVNINQNQYR